MRVQAHAWLTALGSSAGGVTGDDRLRSDPGLEAGLPSSGEPTFGDGVRDLRVGDVDWRRSMERPSIVALAPLTSEENVETAGRRLRLAEVARAGDDCC